MKYDVFISYSSKDATIASEICEMLETNDLTCWIAPRNVVGGKSYAREIIEAITESAVVLFIFSQHSNVSPHVESEIDTAFNQGKIIIPFRIEDTPMSPELSYYLNKNHRIDGIPTPADAFIQLKGSIIQNIPRLQKEKAKENALNLLKEELGCADLSELQEILTSIKEYRSYDGRVQGDSTDGTYDILSNPQGEILLTCQVRRGMPIKPRLVCDGSSTVLLYRNKNSSVVLYNLNVKAIKAILKVDQIVVAEFDPQTDEIVREYYAPIQLVRSLESILNG